VKKLLTTILLLAGMAAPAAAQANNQVDLGPSMNLLGGDGFHLKTDEEVSRERERERAYKSGMSKIPDQKAKNDPWGAVRSTPPTASNQRPAAK
jgi:Ni/Co efflux regulator RcnB